MNKQERLDKQFRMNGNRRVVYNAHMVDEYGVIWCEVEEDTAGFYPMTGRDPLAMPWYLASKSNHTDEDGKVDYEALWENAERTVDKINEERGYTKREVMDIVTSSMRAQGWH